MAPTTRASRNRGENQSSKETPRPRGLLKPRTKRVVESDSDDEDGSRAIAKPEKKLPNLEHDHELAASRASSASNSSLTSLPSKIISLSLPPSLNIGSARPPSPPPATPAIGDTTDTGDINGHTAPGTLSDSIPAAPQISAHFVTSTDDEAEIQRLSESVKAIIGDFETAAASSTCLSPVRRSIYALPESFKTILQDKQDVNSQPQAVAGYRGNHMPVQQMGQRSATSATHHQRHHSGIATLEGAGNLTVKAAPTDHLTEPNSYNNSSSLTQQRSMNFETAATDRRMEARDVSISSGDDELAHKATPASSPDTRTVSDNRASPTLPLQITDSAVAEKMDDLAGQQSEQVEVPIQELSLANQILEEVTNSNRKSLVRGDLAIVFDIADLGHTWVIPWNILTKAAPVIKELLSATLARADGAAAGIRYVLTLKADGNVTDMPKLHVVDPKTTATNFKNLAPNFHMPIPRDAGKVKLEHDSEDEGGAAATLRAKWIDAYELFLAAIVFSGKYHTTTQNDAFVDAKFGATAQTALEKITLLIEVAKAYGAMKALASIFNTLVLRYFARGSLNKAIAKNASSWLLIACTIENEMVFREAFCHVAGCFPHWPWTTAIDKLPGDVQDAIKTKSRELDHYRCRIDKKLHQLTVKAKATSKDKVELPVSQRNNPTKYNVVNFYASWIGEHIAYIDLQDGGHKSPRPSEFCDHADGQCLTRAGLYRAVFNAGEAYLPMDQVMPRWLFEDETDEHEAEIRETLKLIKSEASKIVARLAQSNLQYEGKNTLEYLTCIVINDKDMPWKAGQDMPWRADESDEEIDF